MSTMELAPQKIINNARRDNAGKWYSGMLTWNHKEIRYKGYRTWLQILTIDGVHYENVCDQSVGEFKAHLEKVFS